MPYAGMPDAGGGAGGNAEGPQHPHLLPMWPQGEAPAPWLPVLQSEVIYCVTISHNSTRSLRTHVLGNTHAPTHMGIGERAPGHAPQRDGTAT